MGMYDSVCIRCPECGTEVEFQTKSGDCICARYTYDNVPANVAGGLDGEIEECPECGHMVQIKLNIQLVIT